MGGLLKTQSETADVVTMRFDRIGIAVEATANELQMPWDATLSAKFLAPTLRRFNQMRVELSSNRVSLTHPLECLSGRNVDGRHAPQDMVVLSDAHNHLCRKSSEEIAATKRWHWANVRVLEALNILLSSNGITLETVIGALAERIIEKMEMGNRFGSTKPVKRLLTTEEAAEFLGRTKEAMQHLASNGKIPTVRSDRRVFYDIHDLERWISQNKEVGLN